MIARLKALVFINTGYLRRDILFFLTALQYTWQESWAPKCSSWRLQLSYCASKMSLVFELSHSTEQGVSHHKHFSAAHF